MCVIFFYSQQFYAASLKQFFEKENLGQLELLNFSSSQDKWIKTKIIPFIETKAMMGHAHVFFKVVTNVQITQ